jgi:hypothetical protein
VGRCKQTRNVWPRFASIYIRTAGLVADFMNEMKILAYGTRRRVLGARAIGFKGWSLEHRQILQGTESSDYKLIICLHLYVE